MGETVVGRTVAMQKLEAFERLQTEFEASLCFIQDVHGQRRFPTFPVAETVHYLHALWICAQKDHLLSVSKEHGRYRGNAYLELLHAWQEGKTAMVVAFLQQTLDGLPFADLTCKIEESTSESPPSEGRAHHFAHSHLVLLNREMNLLQAVDAIFMLPEDDLMREVHIACAAYGHTPCQIEQQLAERNEERFAPVPHPLLAQRNMMAMNTLGRHAIAQYTERESVRAWSHTTPADALPPLPSIS